MKIGIIGSGKIGSVVGTLWAKAGHQVLFSSRHPEQLDELVKRAGSNTSRGSIEEALVFGEVIFLSIPYVAVQEFGRDYGKRLGGKIVIETGNPYPDRDGAIGQEVRDSPLGTGIYSQRWLPNTRLVRAFNSVWDQTLVSEAHRDGDQVGIPLAGNDGEALRIVSDLVRQAGFDPVIVGPLERAKDFDFGSKVYNTGMTGAEIRKELGIRS
ncbi:MAG: NAD(P)-binding domain-containing protein [Verrucomicrobia bacterium]|nr:NAD(P)-binding domain-containing protein [Verrucomicrobiota bacterium]